MGSSRRLVQWEVAANPLAPLSTLQRDLVFDLADLYSNHQVLVNLQYYFLRFIRIWDGFIEFFQESTQTSSATKSTDASDQQVLDIDNTQQFLQWYEELETSVLKREDFVYLDYYKQLEERKHECDLLLKQVLYNGSYIKIFHICNQ